jgi:hypothetical protein
VQLVFVKRNLFASTVGWAEPSKYSWFHDLLEKLRVVYVAEMGNDFNILEYADPELDSVTGGEKTNILDENLDLEEEDSSKEEHKGVKKEVPDKVR